MTQKKLTDEQRLYLQSLGVDIVDMPEIYDKVSLFDYINTLLISITTALGTTPPTHQEVLEATDRVIDELDLLIPKDD